MRKLTLLITMLFLSLGMAWAQFDETKLYRIKDTASGFYLNAANHDTHTGGTKGGVNVVALNDASDEMIFIAEKSGEGFKLKTKSGYYINGQEYNVDANSTKDGMVLLFEEASGNYKIKWVSTATKYLGQTKYFKVQNVDGTIYPFCDAASTAAATWAIEEYKLQSREAYVNNGKNINRGDRGLSSFTITNGTESLVVNNIQTSSTAPVYVDKSSQKLITKPGATLSFSAFNYKGNWMHAYAYVDYNKDYHFFLAKNNNGEGAGELVSYNYFGGYDINGNGVNQGTAMGTTFDGSKTLPAFTLPADLAPGEYRMRVKVDWNNIDADYGDVTTNNTSNTDGIAHNGGCQCDITIVIPAAAIGDKYYASLAEAVEAAKAAVETSGEVQTITLLANYNGAAIELPIGVSLNANGCTANNVTVKKLPYVYNFVYGGTVKATQEGTVALGEAYPTVNAENKPLGVELTGVPTGNVALSDVNDEGKVIKEITVTISGLPFDAAADNASIEKWYYIQMHSFDASNTYNKYIQSVSTTEVIWADNSVAPEKQDACTWGFIGNPYDGFKVVNYATGTAIAANQDVSAPVLNEAGVQWIVTASSHKQDALHFCLKYPNGEIKYLNANAKTGALGFWEDSDAGSTMWVTLRDINSEVTALTTLVEQAQALVEGWSGKVGELTEESKNAVSAAIITAQTAISSKKNLGAAKQALETAINNPERINAVATIGEQGYATFAEALTAAAAMTGDVTVKIYGKVTLNGPLTGSYSSIKFVGATAAVRTAEPTDEIYLDIQGYSEAAGKKVAFENLILSKVQGSYVANAGFMNLAFGIYGATEITYTNCIFANGAYASTGDVTYTGCTFKPSWEKYAFWAYGDANITIDNCTFAAARGIKMYDEGKAGLAAVTVKNSNFSVITDKPAIVLTYGESVVLEGNTYSSTGTFELDLDGNPNGVGVTSDVAPVCVNDKGACGVLVDGKIYTTVAQAAEVATSGSNVTLLHNSAENVEFAEGVVLERGSFTAPGVTVEVALKGEGTETSPYLIESADDLAKFRNKVNGGNDYAGKYVKLTSNIELTGEWTAIGNGSRSSKTYTGNAFKGVFDGDGKTISGLKITSTTAADAAIGLFGVVDGGTVKNVSLVVDINVESSNLAGGAIGMMLNGATAEGITVNGAIVGNDGVGGIVGRLVINGTIANCTNNASVTSNYGGIGGIVGKAYYEDASNTSTFATIANCTNKGTITAPIYVGGIAGLARANVTGCVNEGAIKGGTQTGGIVGQLMAAGTISANENNAKVTGTSHVGGIIGDYSQSSSYTHNNVSIADNTNRGELSATKDCAAILGCNNIREFTAMTAKGNVSYYYAEGLALFGTPYDMVIDATNKFMIPVAKIGDQTYYTLAAAVEAAQAGAEIIVIADIADVTVDVTKNLTISGAATLNNVAINANGADALTVKGLTFTGNSWINSGTAETLTVSGITATVNPSNTSYTNSRSAFISLGRSEGQELALTVENSNITVTAAGPDAILGWAKITAATITGNVIKGSHDGYFTSADAIKFMSIANGAKFVVNNNEIYSNYNGIVFAQNTTRDNAYSVSADANKFYGGADHIWIEISGGNTVHATFNATSANTVNGNAFTVADIKYPSAVIKNWSSYAGVDVVTDSNGKVIGGTLAAFSNAESVAEGYEIGTNGVVEKAPTDVKVATLAELQAALAAENELPIIITAEIVIPKGTTVELDLNGKTVNSVFNGTSTTNHIYALSNKGTLTIKDSKGNGSINSRGIYNYGPLTLNSGTINAIDGNGGYAVNNKSGSTFVMNGGTLIASYEDDYQSSNGGYDATALNVPSGCTATLNGGTITDVCDFTFAIAAAGTLNVPETSTVLVQGNHGAVSVSGGVTTINAGTYKVIKDDKARTDNVMYVSGGALVINGGTFVGDSDTASGGSCVCDETGGVTINGGKFSGSSGGDVWGTTGTTIKGGTFENLIEKQHIADGYEIGADGTVVAKPVAEVNGVKYTSLADALAAVQAGEEIKLLADAILDAETTLPAGVTLNGNGKQINGNIVAAGDLTIAGHTKVTNFNAGYNKPTITIGEGACLELTGTGRMVIGHGATFNITGTITEAKTANVAELTPSLVMPGASFTGAGVTFNVTNAYISAPSSYCSSSKSASGTFDFNIDNSIWESAGKLAFEEQSVNAKVDFALVNSVLTTGSHLVFGTASGEEGVVIDNSNVNVGTSRQIENCGTMTIKNGSVVNGAVATSSNAKNPGTIIVENATYAVTGEFSGSDLGTGTLIIKKGANVSVGSIKAGANVTVDAEGMTAGDEINFTANLSQFTGTLSVINNDKLEAKIVDNKIVLVAKPVAKIGEQGYATIKDAVAAVKESETITILAGTHSEGTIMLPATLKNVTIKGAEGAELKDMTISAADGNAYSYVGLTFDGITFDNSRILLTGWRNGDETIENLAVTNCTFKNLNDNTNTAPVHINKDATKAVKNFTFTNNVIDGATGGSKSGIYAQVTGEVKVENNIINNVSFRPYVIQVTTDDGIADNFTVTGNTFSGSAVGRAQGLGNNAEGTDNVNLVVSNNIFKGITGAQQICYWSFNPETTTADLSKNYYDIDIVANPSKIYFNSSAADNYALRDMNVFPIYTELNENGTINTESAFTPKFYIAKVGENSYETLAEAVAAAQAGDEIIMLADVTLSETIVLPAGVTFNGNNKTVTGSIQAGGDLTFKGHTIVSTFSAGWYNNTITIGEGASLKATSGRMTVSYGNIINVIGNLENAKTADKAAMTPSLELTAGISFNGDGGGVQFNVTNAYVKLGDSSTKNSGATGKFNINFNNSIVDFTKTLKTYMPTATGLAPEFNLSVTNSVMTIASHVELWLDKTSVTLDNSDLTVGGSFANAGTVAVKGGANFVVKAPIMSSHGGNTGSIVVEKGTFELQDSNEDWQNAGVMKVAVGGKFITNDFKCVGEGKIVVDAANLQDETVVVDGNGVYNFEAVTVVENGGSVDVSYENGDVTLRVKTLVGAGTEESPYLIQTADDLVFFRNSVNAGETKYSAPGVWVALGADIDMTGLNWVGIGSATAEHGFMGNFDGKNFKIKNLTITDPTPDSDGYAYAGFFGVTEGTDKDNQNTIKNLTIENVTITTTGHIAAAAIAYPYYTIVDNVKVCGNIAIQGGDYTAGVLAYTRRCVNASNLSIVGNDGSFVKGNKVVGGVISDIQMNGGLTAVYSNFSAEGITVSGKKSVGGISGIIATQTLNGATVTNVTLNSEDGFAGVVAGRLGGTSVITDVVADNVTGATTLIGAAYDGAKAVEARIGDTYYATFAAAYTAAQADETITLLAPVTVAKGETLTLDKNVNITYTSNKAGEDMFTNRGTLNISAGKITYVNTDDTGANVTVSTISTEPGSVLNVTGGVIENKTVKADGSSIYSYAIDMLTNGNLGDVTATISGGTVSSDYMAIRQFNNGTACKNTLKITGGTIYGAKRAVQIHMDNNAAYTTFTGGKIEAGANGYSLCNFAGSGNLSVTGGEFIGTVYSKLEKFIAGGIYSEEIAEEYLAEHFICQANNDGTYGVIQDPNYIAELVINDADGEDFINTSEKTVGTLTYKRTLPMANTWMPLYVPFKISLSEEFLKNYDIAYFNDVHGHDDNGDNVIDRTTIELIKISDPNKTIKANYPLVIRALNDDALELKITMDNATLYPSEENTVTVTSALSSYEIKGTYQKHETIADNQRVWGKDENGDAAWGKLKEGSVLNPYRLILTITSRDDANLPFETIRMRVIGEDGEDGITYIEGVHQTVETGDEFIYDLQGRRVFEPTKGGIYIINGKKVYFK